MEGQRPRWPPGTAALRPTRWPPVGLRPLIPAGRASKIRLWGSYLASIQRSAHAETVEEGRLRAHRGHAPRAARRARGRQRAGDFRGVRDPDRADGQGAAAARAARPAHLAAGDARRLPARAAGQRHLGRRRHSGDRRSADGDGLLGQARSLRPVPEVQYPRPAVPDPRAHHGGADRQQRVAR